MEYGGDFSLVHRPLSGCDLLHRSSPLIVTLTTGRLGSIGSVAMSQLPTLDWLSAQRRGDVVQVFVGNPSVDPFSLERFCIC